MKSAPLVRTTSALKVGIMSPDGFWLLIGDEELFVPFAEFPWLRDASMK
jgi:hypothetical protein